jgi:ABC-type branched-subunit amino acid transport system ATPase component
MALFETRALTVRYGGLAANHDINIDVEEGSLVGLIGPNHVHRRDHRIHRRVTRIDHVRRT